MYASDYLENNWLDHVYRGLAWAMPTDLQFSLLSATADDTGINMNEISGGGYARATLAPSASNWLGTGGETSGASAGATGETSNAVAINFPEPTTDWNSGNPITHMGLHDQAGNLLGYQQLTESIVVNTGDPVFFDVGQITWTIDNVGTGGWSDYHRNKFIDHIFRALSFTAPAALNVHLYTAAPTKAGGGTEVSGGSYAAEALNPSESNWTGTGGETIGASAGTSGQVANGPQIDFTTPTAAWGTVVAQAVKDGGGNFISFANLDVAKDILTGNPVFFEAGSLKQLFG